MSQIKKVKILDQDGQMISEYDIMLSEDMMGVLESILPYLIPSLNNDGTIKNIQIASPKNINLEPLKGVKVKVGDSAQIELLPDKSGDLREFVIKTWRSIEVDDDGKSPKLDPQGNPIDLNNEVLVKLKVYCDNLELNCNDKSGTSRSNNKIQFKNKSNRTKGIIEGSSLDMRAFTAGPGTGGGIAVQIAGMDSDNNENKFKIETSRKVDVDATATSTDYEEEGGKGIEIGTINSQMTSIYTKTYRFKSDAPIYAVTRGTVTLEDDKYDYPTQADDSKDIINDDDPITWGDLVAAVKYLKNQSLI